MQSIEPARVPAWGACLPEGREQIVSTPGYLLAGAIHQSMRLFIRRRRHPVSLFNCLFSCTIRPSRDEFFCKLDRLPVAIRVVRWHNIFIRGIPSVVASSNDWDDHPIPNIQAAIPVSEWLSRSKVSTGVLHGRGFSGNQGSREFRTSLSCLWK